MTLLTEGIFPCTVLSAAHGEDDRHMLIARINVRIDEGPDKGRFCTYEDKIDARSALYVSRSCKAVGWTGSSINTLSADVAAWVAKTGGRSTVEIKHIPIKNGKRAGEIWDKVNSIGRGPKPLSSPARETLTDADVALRRAMAEDGGAPPDDAPQSAGQVPNDDIPFVTCGRVGLGEIAKVLR